MTRKPTPDRRSSGHGKRTVSVQRFRTRSFNLPVVPMLGPEAIASHDEWQLRLALALMNETGSTPNDRN